MNRKGRLCPSQQRPMQIMQKAVPCLLHTTMLQPGRPEKEQLDFYSTLIPTLQRSPLSHYSTEQFLLLLLLCRVAWILVSSRIWLIKVWLQFGDLKTLICHLDTEILSKEKMICQKPALSKSDTIICKGARYRFFSYKLPKYSQWGSVTSCHWAKQNLFGHDVVSYYVSFLCNIQVWWLLSAAGKILSQCENITG